MHKSISSLSNPKVKHVIRLRKSSNRRAEGVVLIDGIKELECALQSGAVLEEVYYLDGVQNNALFEQAKDCFSITDSVYQKIVYGDRNEGVVAVVRPVLKDVSDLKISNSFLGVIIENVEKPGNLGAILRTCDGAGVDAVFVCDQQTDLYNANVIRASLGTVFTNNVYALSVRGLIKTLERNRVNIVATTPDATGEYFTADLTGRVAIAMGEEHKGLSDTLLAAAHTKVVIPMSGYVDSLNVSVSTAVVVYESVRQRGCGM